LSPDGTVVAEDVTLDSDKFSLVSDGFILHNMTGIKIHIVKRLDGTGYDITESMDFLTLP
jgi:ER degradation enhancer, mannosidase alpha-like 1